MDDAKVFEAKSLDEAIRLACTFYDAPREKLEIDFLQDAKSGIFGLVGARKAQIRARRVDLGRPAKGDDAATSQVSIQPHQKTPAYEQSTAEENSKPEGNSHSRNKKRPEKKQTASPVKGSAPQTKERKEAISMAHVSVKAADRPAKAQLSRESSETALCPCTALDQERLVALVMETAERLIRPITGPMELQVTVHDDRVDLRVDCDDDLGLLIGRDGQNLASLQYLASRIISRAMASPVRLLITAGDYRERQNEKLRELAISLAEKAKATGRACPTKPLSSYQRRVIHMTLQDDPLIQTRSAGEGAFKRVVVQKRKQPLEASGE